MGKKSASRLAVVGSGISGLSCGWLLSLRYQVDIFEANNYLGGHTNTVDIKVDGIDLSVDTGFMVCNYRTYPNLIQMFDYLNIDLQSSNMSFSVHCDENNLEWSGTNINTVFAQRKNIFNIRFLKMLYDIRRLSRDADRLVNDPATADKNLGQILDREGYGKGFKEWFLVPMAAAIWSTPPDNMFGFPAQVFLRFCDNHGLLRLRDKPKWYTVVGGARLYINKLKDQISGNIYLNKSVTKIRRLKDKVELNASGLRKPRLYDAVVIACHADDALEIIDQPSEDERDILESFPYQHNDTFLHTDASFLPSNKRAVASWNYFSEKCSEGTGLFVTYNLNSLQNLPCSTPVLVTLNPIREPDPSTVLGRFDYAHPIFTKKSIIAQNKIRRIQGQNNTYFAGAWQRYGFHEDGLLSAINVAESFGITTPWSEPNMEN